MSNFVLDVKSKHNVPRKFRHIRLPCMLRLHFERLRPFMKNARQNKMNLLLFGVLYEEIHQSPANIIHKFIEYSETVLLNFAAMDCSDGFELRFVTDMRKYNWGATNTKKGIVSVEVRGFFVNSNTFSSACKDFNSYCKNRNPDVAESCIRIVVPINKKCIESVLSTEKILGCFNQKSYDETEWLQFELSHRNSAILKFSKLLGLCTPYRIDDMEPSTSPVAFLSGWYITYLNSITRDSKGIEVIGQHMMYRMAFTFSWSASKPSRNQCNDKIANPNDELYMPNCRLFYQCNNKLEERSKMTCKFCEFEIHSKTIQMPEMLLLLHLQQVHDSHSFSAKFIFHKGSKVLLVNVLAVEKYCMDAASCLKTISNETFCWSKISRRMSQNIQHPSIPLLKPCDDAQLASLVQNSGQDDKVKVNGQLGKCRIESEGRPSLAQSYHSNTFEPMVPSRTDIDSDDDFDLKWNVIRRSSVIDDYEDIQDSEKLFMKLWNNHQIHRFSSDDISMPASCELFTRRFANEIIRQDLFVCLMQHLLNFWDLELIREETINACTSIIDEANQMLNMLDK